MIKDNFKRSLLAAALITTGSIFAITSAQATIVDLINGNNGTINGAIFDYTNAQPTGTGFINSFLRVQKDGTEQGYNTSGTPVPFDDKSGKFTHDITFAQLQTTTVTIGSTSYFKLLLDVNQSGSCNNPFISLDQLQFYTSSLGSQTTTTVSSLGTLRYTFSVGDRVGLDASRNPGSGAGDMFAYIPALAFAGTLSTDFVYLYCHFGTTYASNDGFEEWALVAACIPEASTFFPVIGLLVAVFSTYELRRRKLKQMVREESRSRVRI
ncbi:MAG TPA: hypothetical protein VIH54_18205 [Chthoniobacterales bacterium]